MTKGTIVVSEDDLRELGDRIARAKVEIEDRKRESARAQRAHRRAMDELRTLYRERAQAVMAAVKEHPTWSYQQIANLLGVNRTEISRITLTLTEPDE